MFETSSQSALRCFPSQMRLCAEMQQGRVDDKPRDHVQVKAGLVSKKSEHRTVVSRKAEKMQDYVSRQAPHEVPLSNLRCLWNRESSSVSGSRVRYLLSGAIILPMQLLSITKCPVMSPCVKLFIICCRPRAGEGSGCIRDICWRPQP